jgi:hypothetical protein
MKDGGMLVLPDVIMEGLGDKATIAEEEGTISIWDPDSLYHNQLSRLGVEE